MNTARILRIAVAASGLVAGLALANGTEPGPDEPAGGLPGAVLSPPVAGATGALPGAMPIMPAPHAWLQAPVAGTHPYYLVPYPALSRPMAPAYPVLPMQAPVLPGWVPFVMVLVPMQAMPQPPAGGDYGPVADTPVVELPPPVAVVPAEGTPATQATTSSEVAPDVASPAQPIDYGPIADAPVIEVPASDAHPPEPAPTLLLPDYGPVTASPVVELPETGMPDSGQASVPAVGAPPPAAQAVVVPRVTVDYGPIAATPVMALPVAGTRVHQIRTRARAAAPSGKAKAGLAVKPAIKPAATSKRGVAVPAPPKKRMCWSNGIVAPCK